MKYCVSSPAFFTIFLFSIAILTGCSTPGSSVLFGKRSAHDQYADKIKTAGLNETAMGNLWFSAADQSLSNPLKITVPYSETGYFPADQPKAVGLQFHAKRGEKLIINLSKKPATGFAIYLDLWQPSSENTLKPKFLVSADTTESTLNFEVKSEGFYILRLQPELLKGGEYTLSISTGPSLAFPVTGKVKSNIGSFWGAGRDAGARKHEGIDIFAPRNTVLVAAVDGVIGSVSENNLGGKVVFLRPYDKDYTLYYAHLDKQLVQPGQRVQVGDTLGLMGNTGNAKTTVPHLHFGIYTNNGAVDPLPFVNPVIKNPEKVSVSTSSLNKLARTNKNVWLTASPDKNNQVFLVESNTLLTLESATGSWYKVVLPDGQKGFIAGSAITILNAPIKKLSIAANQALFDAPTDSAAKKMTIEKGSTANVMASYKDYYYVSVPGKEDGWLPKQAISSK